MATGWGPTAGNAAIDEQVTDYTWIKLHIGAPGAAGTANPAVNTSRQQATWAAASSGATSNTGALTWSSVSTTETYTHWTSWTASTAGTFGFSGDVTGGAVTAGTNFVFAIGDLDVTVPLAS